LDALYEASPGSSGENQEEDWLNCPSELEFVIRNW
jgi:hypothetical protein